MHLTLRLLFLLLLLVIVCADRAGAADLTLSGTAKPAEWSVDQLKQLSSAKAIEYTSRGQKHQATGVPLLALIESAGLDTTIAPSPNVTPAAKHPPLRMALSVGGSDGYAVIFSLAELLPSVGNRSACLVWDIDGKPFAAEQGPLKLIVPDDAGPARAVRQVTKLELIDLGRPSTAPAPR